MDNAAKQINFRQIFSEKYLIDDEEVEIKKVSIPMIQRDYAQGREDTHTTKVRDRFLKSLHLAVTKNPTVLDFIYGDVDKKGNFIPLDGQQRLTTLYLLYWFAAKKGKIETSKYTFLKNFTYDTRHSARSFCEKLVAYEPVFKGSIKEEIINQGWFIADWKQDETVSGMLIMLDAIQQQFDDIEDLWDKVDSNAITFFVKPIKEMGITDDIYIKMNSRGKPLTQFEHFKAELAHALKSVDEKKADIIIKKIDTSWSSLLWQYRDGNHLIDDSFLRYFRFICDIICYEAGDTPQGKKKDELDLVEEYFSLSSADPIANAEQLEKYFDIWVNVNKDYGEPSVFFEKYVSHKHLNNKAVINSQYAFDLFGSCLNDYGKYVDKNEKRRMFKLPQLVLLYAFIQYLLNKQTISEPEFVERFRIINNLVRNSSDETSDSADRQGGNRIPAILQQTKSIILEGKIIPETNIEINFNKNQLKEEIEKQTWRINHPSDIEKLNKLEDHELLYGQVSIVGLDDIALFEKFEKLFNCDRDNIDCALMATGFYGQMQRSKNIYQLGSSGNSDGPWVNLFHMSSNAGFNNTKQVLIALLNSLSTVDNTELTTIKENYINNCVTNQKYDIRYYYLKYNFFRPGKHGKYQWKDFSNKPYELTVLYTEKQLSENAYDPFLYGLDASHLSKDDYGMKLVYSTESIENTNTSFVHNTVSDPITKIKEEVIPQQAGIDKVDRLDKNSVVITIPNDSADITE